MFTALSLLLAIALVVVALVQTGALATWRIARRAERLVPREGRFLDVGDTRIHYVEKGSGPSILFIHGLGAQHRQFSATLFDGLARDFRVVALDRPGSGYSTRPLTANAGVFAQAAAIKALIDSLGMDRPLVVGHSLGGAVALALAVAHPVSISGLALIAPLTRHRPRTPPALASLDIASPLKRWLVAHTVAVPGALKMADATLSYVFAPQSAPTDYMIAGGGWLGLRPSHIYATCSDVVALANDMPDLERRIGGITLPVSVLFGTADNVLSYEQDGASIPSRLPGTALVTLKGVGHMPHIVAVEDTMAFVREAAVRTISSLP